MKAKIILLITALSWAAASFAALPQDLIEQMVPPGIVLPHAREIGLTDAQRQALQPEADALEAKIKPCQQQIREETSALVALVSQEKPDETAVLAQLEKLNAVEFEFKRLRMLMTLRMKAGLTAEQQAKVRRLNAAANSGPRPGGVGAKFERIKQGLERWKSEGRDATQVREKWERSQHLAEEGRYDQARALLDETLADLDAQPAVTKP